MAKYFYFLFVLFFWIQGASSAELCTDLFRPTSEAKLFSNEELGKIFDENTAVISYNKTVETKGVIETHDGPVVVFKLIGYTWHSLYQTNSLTIEGNPLTAIAVLGPKLARVFGFRKISETEFHAPTPERINSVLKEINKLLIKKGHEPIEFNFYDDARPETPSSELATRFEDSTSFPLTTNTDLTVHDYSYHSLAFLTPNKVLKMAREQSKTIRSFIKFVESKRKEINDDHSLDNFIKRLLFLRNSGTDVGTGNLSKLLISEKYGSPVAPTLSSIYQYLIGRGTSCKDYLRSLVKETKPGIGNLNFLFSIEKLLNDFTEHNDSVPFNTPLTNADGSKYTEQDYLREVTQRLKDLQSLFP